ncbi:EF-hand calcium-binding domain-containing protein 9-like [Erpetoichthys calabaricus]|uniref:EF-hand calcium-binding domain-containing protein 9-like n=1 Tax=Erpetoichthys calabaricus TaxID=27687 RepID=UPI002233E53C|nr:EF-hand calcium-binding domain-containing protein 9-like [Erpetoichthys calabaricus]
MDVQFYHFLHHFTNLNNWRIMWLFDMLDGNAKGEVDFEAVYVLLCILLARQNNKVEQILTRHTMLLFQLIDLDGQRCITVDKFLDARFLFGLNKTEAKKMFNYFDLLENKKWNYKEFRLFAVLYDNEKWKIERGALKRTAKKKKATYVKRAFEWMLDATSRAIKYMTDPMKDD